VQVPLLLSLGEGERGLAKALASGDADLVHLALFALHRALPLADFQAALAARPAARRLFEKYCRSQVRFACNHLKHMIYELQAPPDHLKHMTCVCPRHQP